jgi:hypothetical protein
MIQLNEKTLAIKRIDTYVWICTIFIFLLQILLLFSPVREDRIRTAYLAPLIVAMASYLLMRIGWPRTLVVILPVAFTFWFLVCRIINGDWYLQESYAMVYQTLLSCCVLFLVPFLKNETQRDKLFKAFALVYSIAFSAIAWVAIIAALTGNNWVNPTDSGSILGINEVYSNPYRLNILGIHPNISAILFYTSLALLFYLFFRSKRVWSKVVYGLAAVGLYLAICMSGSISAIIVTGAIISLVVFALVFQSQKIIRLRVPIAVLAMLTTCILVVTTYPLVIRRTSDIYDKVHQETADFEQPKIATVFAQENQLQEADGSNTTSESFVEERLEVDSMTSNMQSRFVIYSSAFLSIADRPITLLIGELWQDAMDRSAKVINFPYQNHVHNSFLQTLVVGGGVSFVLMVLFTVLLAIYSIRLFFNKGTPLYLKMLVLAPVGLLCHSMTEAILFVDSRIPNMLFFLVAGMIIAYGKEITAKEDT